MTEIRFHPVQIGLRFLPVTFRKLKVSVHLVSSIFSIIDKKSKKIQIFRFTKVSGLTCCDSNRRALLGLYARSGGLSSKMQKRENAKDQFYGHPRDWPWPWICNLVAKIACASKNDQIDRVIHSSSITKGGQFDRVRCKLIKFQKIITRRPRGGDHGNLPPSFDQIQHQDQQQSETKTQKLPIKTINSFRNTHYATIIRSRKRKVTKS